MPDVMLIKVYSGGVVYLNRKTNRIFTAPLNPEAKVMLDWYNRHIPANN